MQIKLTQQEIVDAVAEAVRKRLKAGQQPTSVGFTTWPLVATIEVKGEPREPSR